MDPSQGPSKERKNEDARTSRPPRDADHADEDSSSPDQPHYRCTVCGSLYRTRADFKMHMCTFHPRSMIGYECSYCYDQHEDFEALQRHVFTQHCELRVYECADCRSWFPRKKAMECHQERHQDRLKRRTCEVCSVVFSTWQKFKAHWRLRHEPPRDHVCSVCGERFTKRYNLSRHEMHKHPRDGKTRRWVPACVFCGRTFSKKQHLEEHRCIKMGGKPTSSFECSICGKEFESKENMLRHEKVHSDKRPFKCKDCNFKFTKKEHLERHLVQIHEYATEDYICDGCNKVYKSVEALSKHKKICGEPVAGPSKPRKSSDSDDSSNDA